MDFYKTWYLKVFGIVDYETVVKFFEYEIVDPILLWGTL